MVLPTLRTYIAPTTRSLLQHLGRAPTIPSSSVNLFALSAHVDDLQDAVAYLTALPNSIGALTASPYRGVQLAIASYPATSCLSFRSTIPGIPQAEVGRIRTYRPPTRGDKASEARLDNALSGGIVNWNDALSESGSLELPPDLQHIRTKSSVSSFLYLSDGAPEGLLNSLGRHFPATSQTGLIGSSTPFITGRPFTLFKGSSIYPDGAVGVAIFDQRLQHASIEFKSIHAVSHPMEVTQAQTNLVETLDHGNPVESLLLAMKSSGSMNKDQEIYLAVLDSPSTTDPNPSEPCTYNYSQVYRITAGGPSRGSILLDAAEGPQVGTKVQFVVIDASKKSPPSLIPINKTAPTVTLSIISDSDMKAVPTDSDVQEIDNAFLGASENGFILGHGEGEPLGKPWICTVPGATCSLQWRLK